MRVLNNLMHLNSILLSFLKTTPANFAILTWTRLLVEDNNSQNLWTLGLAKQSLSNNFLSFSLYNLLKLLKLRALTFSWLSQNLVKLHLTRIIIIFSNLKYKLDLHVNYISVCRIYKTAYYHYHKLTSTKTLAF